MLIGYDLDGADPDLITVTLTGTPEEIAAVLLGPLDDRHRGELLRRLGAACERRRAAAAARAGS